MFGTQIDDSMTMTIPLKPDLVVISLLSIIAPIWSPWPVTIGSARFCLERGSHSHWIINLSTKQTFSPKSLRKTNF